MVFSTGKKLLLFNCQSEAFDPDYRNGTILFVLQIHRFPLSQQTVVSIKYTRWFLFIYFSTPIVHFFVFCVFFRLFYLHSRIECTYTLLSISISLSILFIYYPYIFIYFIYLSILLNVQITTITFLLHFCTPMYHFITIVVYLSLICGPAF